MSTINAPPQIPVVPPPNWSQINTSLHIENEELEVEDWAFEEGLLADVYLATWRDESKKSQEPKLAVKKFRSLRDIPDMELNRMQMRLEIEVAVWREGHPHPNILPFTGLYHGKHVVNFPSLVSPYQPDRDVQRYLKSNNLDVDRRNLELLQALDIAEGVKYLHSRNIIHGDLKPRNILIHRGDQNRPIAQIADFGRSKITTESGFTSTLRSTTRYTAPEVLGIAIPGWIPQNGNDSTANNVLSLHSDVYGMGMTILEVLSNKEPYYNKGDTGVIQELMAGRGPELADVDSAEFSMGWVWKLLVRCWMMGAPRDNRIDAGEFVDGYRNVSAN